MTNADDSLLISRRSLMSLAAAGALSSLAAPQLASAQAQAAPRKGGTLRIAVPDNPDTLDPQASASGVGWQISALIYDNLTALDAHDQAIPQLATSWKSSGDAKDWTFELRQGVSFHHGKAFGAEDVVATIRRAQDKSLGLFAYGNLGPIASIEATGPFTVLIKLTQPFAELPVLMASEFGRILAADRFDSVKTAPSGTGAFKFKEYLPGSSVSVERNGNYWQKDLPLLDGVRIVVIKDSIAQQAALTSGTVDIVTRLSPEAMLVLKRLPTIKTQSVTTGAYHVLMMQANMAPFDNPKVREAFKYLIDRDALLASALFGNGGIGNDVVLPPGNDYLPPLPSHKQDLAKAKALLAEAGVPNLALDIYTTSDRPPAPKIALALAEAAGRIGVKLTIRDVPYTEYTANVSKKKPLYTASFGGTPTLYGSVYRFLRTGMVYNYGQEGTPESDAKLDAMIAETDREKRKAILAEVLKDAQEMGGRVIPYFLPYTSATSAKVNGYSAPLYNVIDVKPIWLSA